jgi:predicted TIM-barrel fold metal-dependent hydrolase
MSVPITDTNVSLFRWPFRRVKGDETSALAEKLRSHGVTAAWAGSFEGLLHRDLGGVNARLAEECANFPLFVPFGSVNPTAPDWEEDVRRCHEEYRMPGLRLHPNYHGYELTHPGFAKLLRVAAERGLLVQLALVMEDERTQHPLLRVPPVDVTPLPPLVRETPGLRLVLLNALRTVRLEEVHRLVHVGEIAFEISMLERLGGVGALLGQAPLERVLFGSHAPLFYFESAEGKLRESVLSEEQKAAITSGNAANLLRPR